MKLHVEKVALKKPTFYLSILKTFSVVGQDGIWIKDRSRWQWRFYGLRDPGNKAENIFGALVWKFWLTSLFLKLSFVKILTPQSCVL